MIGPYELNQVYSGHCLELLQQLPTGSIHAIITSPPYYGLRNYGTDLVPWPAVTFAPMAGLPPITIPEMACSLGLEPDLWAYVGHLVAVFREARRALRDDGVLWLNLGDSYASTPPGCKGVSQSSGLNGAKGNTTYRQRLEKSVGTKRNTIVSGLKPKDLMGIPWRVALALQADGWYLRSDIIWCLSGETWIYVRTQKGDMPMMVRDAARLDPKTVKLWNGEKWTQVLGWSRTSRNADELEIVLRSGERISCTPAHQFPTNRGLLTASELQVGDVLQSVRLPEPETPYNPPIVTDEAAWFIGLYLAEGSRSGNTIQIAGHIKEDERLERIKKIAEFYGGSVTLTDDGNSRNIRVYGRFLNALIDQYVSGKTAKDKGLKVRCWSHNNDWLRSLLHGYLSGDGHWDKKNRRWRLGFTRNYNLERDLRVLVARLGLSLTLNLSSVGYKGKDVPTFRGELRFEQSTHHNNRSKNEILEIRKARCREVYDIGVEDEPHLFALASGILTHNSKPNPMPESVTDRPTKAHEYVFLLSKSERYFYDQEAIREANSDPNRADFTPGKARQESALFKTASGDNHRGFKNVSEANGRNRRTVWTVATQPYPGSHFAVFPPKLIEPMVLAAPGEVCGECGAPMVRVVEKIGKSLSVDERHGRTGHNGQPPQISGNYWTGPTTKATDDWQPSCTCDAPTVPAVILDPFFGSGTLGQVAIAYRRNFIGFELNPEYADELVTERLNGTQVRLI